MSTNEIFLKKKKGVSLDDVEPLVLAAPDQRRPAAVVLAVDEFRSLRHCHDVMARLQVAVFGRHVQSRHAAFALST